MLYSATMSLEMKDLDHVLKLAHLHVESGEKNAYLGQLHSVLTYMQLLEDLDLTQVDPTSYAFQQDQYLREDEIGRAHV